MKHIVFENSGELDLRLVANFGCSVKESKNPIGFFGTGLKFAIAVLLRTKHAVSIQIGLTEHTVSISPQTVRGKLFEFVMLGDTPLGFTAELGKTWEVWMAYRELYCNAVDEPDGSVYESDETPNLVRSRTRIIVTGDPIVSVHRQRDEFILTGKPDFHIGSIEVFNRPTSGFFYKGIKVGQFNTPAMFTYNQTSHVDLTEDRTVKDLRNVQFTISREILAHADRRMLEAVLIADDNHVEHFFDYHGWTATTPSKDFFATISALQKDNLSRINNTALRVWRESGKGVVAPSSIPITRIQQIILDRAIQFCTGRLGFEIAQYPVRIVETFGEPSVLAMADRNGKQILLSKRLFDANGVKRVARAIAEEYIHLKLGYDDYTNEMQNYLFEKWIATAEELHGEPL